jgi:Tol biopolymer transport system component
MQRRLLLCLCGALVLGLTACGAGKPAGGGHGILFLRTPADNGRVQQISLWRPGASPRPLGPSTDWILTPQWSPDGKSIAFADERGGWDDPDSTEIYVMRADGSKLRDLTSVGATVFRDEEPSWSPDGRRIVFVRVLENSPYLELGVVDVRTGRVRPLHVSGESPAWGKAGIVYAGGHGQLMLVSPGGRPKLFARASTGWFTWSRGGVLAALERGRVVLFSGSGRQVGQLPLPFERKTHVCGIAWSPDGKRLVVGTAQHQVGLWIATVAGGHWRRLPVTHGTSNIDNCALSWR